MTLWTIVYCHCNVHMSKEEVYQQCLPAETPKSIPQVIPSKHVSNSLSYHSVAQMYTKFPLNRSSTAKACATAIRWQENQELLRILYHCRNTKCSKPGKHYSFAFYHHSACLTAVLAQINQSSACWWRTNVHPFASCNILEQETTHFLFLFCNRQQPWSDGSTMQTMCTCMLLTWATTDTHFIHSSHNESCLTSWWSPARVWKIYHVVMPLLAGDGWCYLSYSRAYTVQWLPLCQSSCTTAIPTFQTSPPDQSKFTSGSRVTDALASSYSWQKEQIRCISRVGACMM